MTLPVFRTVLVVAALCALVVVFNAFPAFVRIVCLIAIGVAVVVTAPRRGHGGLWWYVLLAGAALSIVGALLAELSQTVGGVLALVGGLSVIAGAILGLPSEEEFEEAAEEAAD